MYIYVIGLYFVAAICVESCSVAYISSRFKKPLPALGDWIIRLSLVHVYIRAHWNQWVEQHKYSGSGNSSSGSGYRDSNNEIALQPMSVRSSSSSSSNSTMSGGVTGESRAVGDTENPLRRSSNNHTTNHTDNTTNHTNNHTNNGNQPAAAAVPLISEDYDYDMNTVNSHTGLMNKTEVQEQHAQDWQRLGRAIDRICRCVIPFVYIICICMTFRKLHR